MTERYPQQLGPAGIWAIHEPVDNDGVWSVRCVRCRAGRVGLYPVAFRSAVYVLDGACSTGCSAFAIAVELARSTGAPCATFLPDPDIGPLAEVNLRRLLQSDVSAAQAWRDENDHALLRRCDALGWHPSSSLGAYRMLQMKLVERSGSEA